MSDLPAHTRLHICLRVEQIRKSTRVDVVVPGAVNSLADLLSVYILPDQSATCGDMV